MKTCFWLAVSFLSVWTTPACIWDADTLWQEKWRHHDLASAVLENPPEAQPQELQRLRERAAKLESKPEEKNPEWWNNLAGAYLRLNQPEKALRFLKPAALLFPGDYGIHANLGTAHHLLGQYVEAEKEIALDLAINPDAHFGLEKYHLALLQYLIRDADYKKSHVYVDEFSRNFRDEGRPGLVWLRYRETRLAPANTNGLDAKQIRELENELSRYATVEARTNSLAWAELQELKSEAYVPPPYRFHWDLAADPHFEAGVIYMAQMNPREPACVTMLGVAALSKRDYNLASLAYKKAVLLGSPLSPILQTKITELDKYIGESLHQKFWQWGFIGGLGSVVPLLIGYHFFQKRRDRRRAGGGFN